VPFAPREIRRQTFTLVRRGYDTTEVGEYLGKLADQVEAVTAAARQSRYRKLGQEVEAVLRTAHEQAARMRGAAKRSADATRNDAALYSLEQKRGADQDRDEAKRMLVRSQERSASLVRQAEEQAAGIVRTAEALARTRTTQVLAQAQRRLDRLTRDEHQAQSRLRTAQLDLQAVIERVGDPGGNIIDLTAVPPAPAQPEPTESSDQDDASAPADRAGEADGGEPVLDTRFSLGRDGDPVAEMVREAVATAVEHSSPDRAEAGSNH
jgi:DivIVA domain-containing protein